MDGYIGCNGIIFTTFHISGVKSASGIPSVKEDEKVRFCRFVKGTHHQR